jgi:hypothetical protein
MDLNRGFNRIMVAHFQKRKPLLQNTYDPFNVVSKKCMTVVEEFLVVSITMMITPTPPKFTKMVPDS